MNKNSTDIENICAQPISNHANKVVLGHGPELRPALSNFRSVER